MPGVRLRSQTESDEEFLLALYASTRAEELQAAPWTAEQRDAFLRSQFRAQTYHYRTYYPDAAFQIVTFDDAPIGRLYVWRSEQEIHIMDIALLPVYRGREIGSTLLGDTLGQADGAGLPVTIRVERNNRALRLYLRLGFSVKEDGIVYLLLQREPSAPSDGAKPDWPGMQALSA